MQQFLLFCIMLTITSEAFSEEFYGSKNFKSSERKTRLSPKPKFYNHDMFGYSKFPMYSVPSRHKRPHNRAPFFIHRPFVSNNGFLPNNKRFIRRKRLKKKMFKQRKRIPTSVIDSDSFTMNSPQCFETSRDFRPEFRVRPKYNFSYFDDSPRSVRNRHSNQLNACMYPLCNNFNKRTLNILNKRKFSALEKPYLNYLKDNLVKNKRSAITKSSDDEITSQRDSEKGDRSENHFRNFQKAFGNFEDVYHDNLNEEGPESCKKLYNKNCIEDDCENQPENNCEDENEKHKKNQVKNWEKVPEKITTATVAPPINLNLRQDKDEISPNEKKTKYSWSKYYEESDKTENTTSESLPQLNEDDQISSTSFSPSFSSNKEVTQPPATTPTNTYKHLVDENLYESSLTKEDDWSLPSVEAEEASDTEDEQIETSTHHDILKLKKILEEAESLLESEDSNKMNVFSLKEEGSDNKASKKTQKSEVTTTITSTNGTASIKRKIDTVALPVLRELSDELQTISNLISAKAASVSTAKQKTNSTEKRKISHSFLDKLKQTMRIGKKKSGKNKDKKTDKKEKSTGKEQLTEPCNANGNWKSTALGFDMTFTMMQNLMFKVKIHSKADSLINEKWAIQGLSLSRRGGPFMLGAVYPQKRKLASFIGQCKTCKNEDLIFGVWTIYTCGKRFTDIWRAVETKLDILKKVRSDSGKKTKSDEKT